MQLKLGWKLRSLREAKGLTQAELSRVLGIENRQSLGLIEAGARKMSAEELVRAVDFFEIPLEEFATPFVVSPDSRFSWRQSGVSDSDLLRFEQQAGEWLAAWLELAQATGHDITPVRQRLALTRSSTFEEASTAGERIAELWELGTVPAKSLPHAVEKQLSALVLMVDALPGISGAACRLPTVDAILINRHEPAYRQNFDLAHEVFHVMTWESMPPEHTDGASQSNRRVEQLADSFASGLLMPAWVLNEYDLGRPDLASQIAKDAEKLNVSGTALRWRLVNAGRIPESLARTLSEEELRGSRPSEGSELPPLYSKKFMEILAQGIAAGHISVARTAKLARTKVDELADLFSVHEIACPFEL